MGMHVASHEGAQYIVQSLIAVDRSRACRTRFTCVNSEHRVRHIIAEKSALSGAAFSSPLNRYKVGRKRINLDFDKEALRRFVQKFYNDKKNPTLDSLLVSGKGNSLVSALLCGRFYVKWLFFFFVFFFFFWVLNIRW